jgi:hypothetical protein
MKKKPKMKINDHFLAWIFIYSIGVFLSILGISYFNLESRLAGIFLGGLIITLFSGLMYSLLYNYKFRLNKWFFIWFFTHAFNFWLIDLFLKKLTLTYDGFLYFLIFGIIYHIITWLIKHKIYYKIKMNNLKTIIIILVIIIALLFVSSQSFSGIQKDKINENSSFISNLKDLVSFNFKSSNNCPQIDVPFLETQDKSVYSYYITNIEEINSNSIISIEDAQKMFLIKVGERDIEDFQKGWEISVYDSSELFGLKNSMVFCHKGKEEGENPNYFYCDSGITGGIPYLSKTQINPDGTIGKTIRKSFINIYGPERKFIKTICGEPPEDISEKEFKKTMREMDNFFSLK